MRLLGRGTAITFCAASAFLLSSALPASAASAPSWRVVFRHLYSAGNSTYFGVAAVKGGAWAVGGADYAGPTGGVPVGAHYRKGRWVAVSMPAHLTSTLEAVSADSSTDAWAVSNFGGYVLHWHNGRWAVAHRWPESGLAQELTGVLAFSPANVWVFGGSGANPGLGTWHLHGRTWTKVTGLGGNVSFASALSPTNMWAVGGINVGEDSILHYVSGRWHHITSPALRGLQFSAILADSRDVWAVATEGGGPGTARLLHLHAGRWSTLAMPKAYLPIHMARDGRGGFWFTAVNVKTSAVWLLHRSASGRWTVQRDPGAIALGRIPGTATSLWGAGSVSHGSGFEAAAFAYGQVG
jgi:hypothetical protein